MPFLGKSSSANQQAFIHQKLFLEILLIPTMLIDFDRFSVIVLLVSRSEVFMSQYYKADLNVDDKLSAIAPLNNTDIDSHIRCATLWVEDCITFSFNWQRMMCRLHGSYDPSTMTVNVKGWRTYANQSFGG